MWFQLSMDAFSLYCTLPVTLGPTGLPHSWCCLSSPWWSCGEDCFLMWSRLAGCCPASLLGEAFFFTLPSAPIAAAAYKFSPNNFCFERGFFVCLFVFQTGFCPNLVWICLWCHCGGRRPWFICPALLRVAQGEAHSAFTTYFCHTWVHISCLWAFFCGDDGTY